MILIKNTQRKFNINITKLRANAQTILDALGYPDFDLGIWLTNNKTIKYYNKTYRHKDKPTDILSFSFYPELKPGQRIKTKNPEEMALGDLIISVEYVAHAAQDQGIALEQHLQRLLVHGVCHLLGYDHEKDEDYEKMQKIENQLLKKLQT
jgi:rRNA maturation RNase YbeY